MPDGGVSPRTPSLRAWGPRGIEPCNGGTAGRLAGNGLESPRSLRSPRSPRSMSGCADLRRFPSVRAQTVITVASSDPLNIDDAQERRTNAVFSTLFTKLKRKGETKDESRVKMVLIPPLLMLIFLFLGYIIYQVLTYDSTGPLRIAASVLAVLVLLVVAGTAFRLREIPQRLILASGIALMCVSLLADLANTGTYELWLFAILLSDTVVLTCRPVHPAVSWLLFVVPGVWIVLRTLEDTIRFGMYSEVPWNDAQPPRAAMGWDWGVPAFCVRLCVFTYHHVLTRRFLVSIQAEEARLREAVVMAQLVTDALVDFDLDRAALLVASGRNTIVRDNFLKLLDNLRMYKPYLPAFVFVRGEENDFQEAEDFARMDSGMSRRRPLANLHSELDFTALQHAESEEDLMELLQASRRDNYQTILRQRLEVGMRMRKGSLMRVVFETTASSLTSLFERAAPFAELVLQEVDSWGGVVVDLKGPVALAAWNTHLPCPRYCFHALRCMTSVSDAVTRTALHLPLLTFGIASGTLGVGATGGSLQRSPFVLGSSLQQVESMHLLCRAVSVRLMITESVYEATRTHVAARVVDVIPEWPRCLGSDMSDVITVYEVLEHPLPNISQYQEAFGALRSGQPEKAIDLLKTYLARSGGTTVDFQAVRLMRLALTEKQAAQDGKAFLPTPYARQMVGWRSYEADATAVDEDDLLGMLDVTSMMSQSHSRTPTWAEDEAQAAMSGRVSPVGGLDRHRSSYSSNRRSSRADQMLSEFRMGARRMSATPGSPADATRDISPALTMSPRGSPLSPLIDRSPDTVSALPAPAEVAGASQASSDVVSTTSTATGEKKYLRDVDGSKWYRSEKKLGHGTFGDVWLGMGEDGALVAMKWLKPMDRAPHAAKSERLLRCITAESSLIVSPPVTPLMPNQVAAEGNDGSPQASAKSLHMESIHPRAMTKSTVDPDDHEPPVSPQHSLAERGPQPSEDFDADAVNAVKKEIELLAKLRHDNIVSYLSVGRSGSQIVILMEYVSGGSLQTLLEQFGQFPMSSIRRYTKDIIRGLRYLHIMSVAHRDFKPGNVLVQIDGQCKITDFGASAVIGEVTGKTIEGTLCYMAPEACRGATTTASDIWSLGISMCQMITARVPYNEELLLEPHAFLYRMANLKAEDVPEVPATDDKDLMDFVDWCLTLDVDVRPTAEQLLLHAFLA